MILKSDVFGITSRLRRLDKKYCINWNKRKRRYEVGRVIKGRFVTDLVVPYRNLDVRTVLLVNKSSVKNFNSIIRDCERHNTKLRQSNLNEQKYQLNYDLKLHFKY